MLKRPPVFYFVIPMVFLIAVSILYPASYFTWAQLAPTTSSLIFAALQGLIIPFIYLLLLFRNMKEFSEDSKEGPGAIPVKSFLTFLLLSIVQLILNLVIIPILLPIESTKNLLVCLWCLSFSFLGSGFVYILYDRMIMVTFRDSGIYDYPEDRRDLRQYKKLLIIPIFILVMSSMITGTIFSLFFLGLGDIGIRD